MHPEQSPVSKYLARIVYLASLPTFVSSYRELLSRKSIGTLIIAPQFIRASTVTTLPEPGASGGNKLRRPSTGCMMTRGWRLWLSLGGASLDHLPTFPLPSSQVPFPGGDWGREAVPKRAGGVQSWWGTWLRTMTTLFLSLCLLSHQPPLRPCYWKCSPWTNVFSILWENVSGIDA